MYTKHLIFFLIALTFSCEENVDSNDQIKTIEDEPKFDFSHYLENSKLLSEIIGDLSTLLKTQFVLEGKNDQLKLVQTLCNQCDYLIEEVDGLIAFSRVNNIFENKMNQLNLSCQVYNDIVNENFNLGVEDETKILLKNFELDQVKISKMGYLVQRRIMIQSSTLYLLNHLLIEDSGISF